MTSAHSRRSARQSRAARWRPGPYRTGITCAQSKHFWVQSAICPALLTRTHTPPSVPGWLARPHRRVAARPAQGARPRCRELAWSRRAAQGPKSRATQPICVFGNGDGLVAVAAQDDLHAGATSTAAAIIGAEPALWSVFEDGARRARRRVPGGTAAPRPSRPASATAARSIRAAGSRARRPRRSRRGDRLGDGRARRPAPRPERPRPERHRRRRARCSSWRVHPRPGDRCLGGEVRRPAARPLVRAPGTAGRHQRAATRTG